MKKLATLLTLMAGIGFALGQGTTMSFNNNGVATGGDHKVYFDSVGNQPGVVGTNYWCELFYVDTTAGNALTPLASSISKFRVTSTASPGTWSGKTVTVPIGGQTIPLTVEIHVWDAVLNPGADMVGGAGYKGISPQFVYTWANSTPAAPADTQLVTMPAFAITQVPEPSAIALSVIGVAGLLFLRRRK